MFDSFFNNYTGEHLKIDTMPSWAFKTLSGGDHAYRREVGKTITAETVNFNLRLRF